MQLSWRIATLLLLAGLGSAGAAAALDYEFDRVHSQVGFEVSHAGFSMSQGRFKGIDGTFKFNPRHWDQASCDVRIDIASLDMGDAAWRKKLLGKDWFNAGQHPQMRYLCTRLEQIDERHGRLHGELSLLGVTRPVTLDLTLNRVGMHKFALQYAAGFSASARLRRSEFGMDRSIPDIGDDVIIRIEIEATRRKKK